MSERWTDEKIIDQFFCCIVCSGDSGWGQGSVKVLRQKRSGRYWCETPKTLVWKPIIYERTVLRNIRRRFPIRRAAERHGYRPCVVVVMVDLTRPKFSAAEIFRDDVYTSVCTAFDPFCGPFTPGYIQAIKTNRGQWCARAVKTRFKACTNYMRPEHTSFLLSACFAVWSAVIADVRTRNAGTHAHTHREKNLWVRYATFLKGKGGGANSSARNRKFVEKK